MAVHYTDERVQGQPMLCLRSYRDGKLAAERCDPDKRTDDTWWDIGVLDSATGKTPEALAAEKVAASSPGDAGAADGAVPRAGEAGADGGKP